MGAFLVSVQGPRSRDMLRPAINLDTLGPFSVQETMFRDIPVIVARTGYSGELGFEFLVWPEHAPSLWEAIIELGDPYGALPYGMNTTLIMGIEKGYLNVWDFYTGSTPLELGLGWAVDLRKPDFMGRDAVLRRHEEGIRTRLVGLELTPDVPTPSYGDCVIVDGKEVGKVTNAGVSPRLEQTIARAWLPADVGASASEAYVITNGTISRATICQHYCWYDPAGKRLRM
jgi:aminomethyltransferase